MRIVQVIPFAKLPLDRPQAYSYFTSFNLLKGSLVLVPLYKREIKAVVIDSYPISQLNKMEIRKASFELKQIIKVLCPKPILTKNQFSLIEWMVSYYYVSSGLIVKTVLPEKLTRNEKKLVSLAGTDEQVENNGQRKDVTDRLSDGSFFVSGGFPDRMKTYLKEIENTLNDDKGQVLILVPLVFNIEQIKEKIKNEFPDTVISCVSSRDNITVFRDHWKKIKSGFSKIIIGTRSAAFMPFKNLRLIIIDEEENSGHISWDMSPKYDVRKVAEKLARLDNAKLILGSYIPSVEYYYKLSPTKKFQVPHQYGGQASSPPIRRAGKFQVVDMRDEIRKGNYSIISDDLLDELKSVVNKGGNAVLFVNRRGAFRFVMCRDCGLNIKCKNCDVPMVCHKIGDAKFAETLRCHHCDFQSPVPSKCPRCQGSRIKGFGIGTQRVEQEIKKLFPDVKLLRIDSDTSNKFKIQNSKFKIIVGTQMIFSLPWLKKTDLVGIVTIDSMLNLPDWRSGEKTFQTIVKLSEYGKSVMIQTYNPDNFVIQSAVKEDYQSFYKKEIEERKELLYPPFSQIVKLVYKDAVFGQAEGQARDLELKIKSFPLLNKSFFVLGPSPAFVPKERNKWVWQIIIKIKDENVKNDLLCLAPPDWEIEVDPENLL